MFQHFCCYHFFLFKTALMIYCSRGKRSFPDCFQKTTQNRYFSIYKNLISRTLINNITTCTGMYFLKLQNYLRNTVCLEIQLFRLWFAHWAYVYLWPSLTSRCCHCQQELSCFNNNYCYSYVSTPTLILIKLCTLPFCLFFWEWVRWAVSGCGGNNVLVV